GDLLDYARDGLDAPALPVRALGGDFGSVSPRRPGPEPQARSISPDVGLPRPVPAAAPVSAETDSAGEGAAEAFSGTNTQEAGVDEPDFAKSDGKRLFVVVGSALWAFDVTGDLPKLISKLDLEGNAGAQLLLRKDRLLVLGVPAGPSPVATVDSIARPAQSTTPAPAPRPSTDGVSGPATVVEKARLQEVDVRDTAAMKIVREMTVPGSLVSARLTDGTIRMVFNSPTTAQDPMVAIPDTPAGARKLERLRAKFGLSDFVPRTVLKSRRTDRTFRRNLVPCDKVRHPTTFAGLDLLTVLTVDFDNGLFNVDRDAVMASAQTVYASQDNLYVASTAALEIESAGNVPDRMKTQIHRFDASKAGETTYASSGSVDGFVLNSYSMSEYQGDLRVATTELPLWLPGAAQADSESAVTVLRPSGNRLAQVGRVGGLGKGERIYATRFIGDVGYLVTFRQTDPLYTLDLKDPASPKVVGELKINGYSAYLHPIGDDLLLGVGQDATETGRRLGAQVSLFDVSNPAAPVRTSQLALSDVGGSSATEFDPHAFLWWGPANTAILPVSSYDPATYRVNNAAVGVTATRAAGLAKSGEITHGPAWELAPVERSLVVGDRVFSVSDFGVSSNRLPGLQPLGFAAFAG
ncbi:MAG: beta-propeller domain-containing protein, partial [Solirubrobacteraceae bacterium]|nr:beta-propeller domain-containing protein [Solirubrobacteraceae bacterium]